ncbi:hypothetical protein TSAR_014606 [Trichomalopsis sarcophagae]|uniref:Uncharacterized protein n=1 Tax=Trichomalopsis sarcophagae TaxID=543379 RepID=A0A232EGV3_9HYME|nr:hypothetical protein TSAR_014606 [Trichomalopsis sarcophagae]
MTHVQAKAILQVLKTHKYFSAFHVDPRTILKTSSLLTVPIQVAVRIANIENSSSEVVGIYRGSGKPVDAVGFFQPFVQEVLQILKDGCFVANGPARSFGLRHRGHNSTAPCSRCWVRGKCLRAGVMVYEGVDFVACTLVEYSSRVNSDHHKGPDCPIGVLPFNVVVNTVFDYMHLGCLGIMEKILCGLIDGRFSESVKLSSSVQVKVLSTRLEQVKEYCPLNFARKPIDIVKHSKFKATEFRYIHLYSGPAIFYGLVTMRILIHQRSTPQFINFAESCLELFVKTASEVYGVDFLSYNTHCLLHLADDRKLFGPLKRFSSFPLRRIVRITTCDYNT